MANLARALVVLGYLLGSSCLLHGLTMLPAYNADLCGDWINYNNEKCFKVVDKVGLQTKEVAEFICRSFGEFLEAKPFPRIITIKNKEQQKFLHKLFLNESISANVWLGLTKNNNTGQYEWIDGSKLVFSNLAIPNTTDSNSQCVTMNLNETGLWQRVSCTNQNRIICERDVTWPLANLEGFQQDSNQSGAEWNDIKSEKDCKEKIMESEYKTNFLKEAAEKAVEVMKDAAEGLIDATEKLDDLGKIEKLTEEISRLPASGPLKTQRASSRCGDWAAYKDEKCFKIVLSSSHQTREDAEMVCEAFSEELNHESFPRLISIKTKEEQEFLEHFLFTENKILNNVWLGLKDIGKNGTYQWNDGSEIFYSNWLNQTHDDRHHCIEMESGSGTHARGLWSKVDCKKGNVVVCERTQTWTLESLQNAFLNNRLEQEQQKKEWEKEVKALNEANEVLKQEIIAWKPQQPVIIGYIYIQIAGQDPPTTLWPLTNWSDISSSYAGLFFRVIGGNAASFGRVQEESTKRLEDVQYLDPETALYTITVPSPGSWSPGVRVAAWASSSTGDWGHLSFRISTGEVRPRNQAIKMWKRVQ